MLKDSELGMNMPFWCSDTDAGDPSSWGELRPMPRIVRSKL